VAQGEGTEFKPSTANKNNKGAILVNKNTKKKRQTCLPGS
jgi:hypothetical protein